MSPGQKFQAASAAVVSKFANKGILMQPMTDVYDPLTGKQALSYIPHHLEYVTVSNKALEKASVNMTAGIRETVIWFTFPQEIVNSTWGVLSSGVLLPSGPVEPSETEAWTDYFKNVWYDEDNARWIVPYTNDYPIQDIRQIEKVVVNDVIVGYYALLEYRENLGS